MQCARRRDRFPGLVGKVQQHHVVPRYLGGTPNRAHRNRSRQVSVKAGATETSVRAASLAASMGRCMSRWRDGSWAAIRSAMSTTRRRPMPTHMPGTIRPLSRTPVTFRNGQSRISTAHRVVSELAAVFGGAGRRVPGDGSFGCGEVVRQINMETQIAVTRWTVEPFDLGLAVEALMNRAERAKDVPAEMPKA